MRHASGVIWEAAGRPIDDAWAGDTQGRCRLCGANGVGREWKAWVKPTFTDHDLAGPGDIICMACLFCTQERTEWLARRTGRDKGQRMRTYSHIVLRGEWHVLSKADKPAMRELLMHDPEIVVIADSGQKHLILRARPGWWQFELHPPIHPDVQLLASMLTVTDALYAGGASKDAIMTGRYDQRTIRSIGVEQWRLLESQCRGFRGRPMFGLAVFLTLKPETMDNGDADGGSSVQHASSAGQIAIF